MHEMTIKVYEIATDGMPPRLRGRAEDDMTGRVAFIWDGNLVSGWPVYDNGGEGVYFTDRWEAAEDCMNPDGNGYRGVTHWVELPEPPWQMILAEKIIAIKATKPELQMDAQGQRELTELHRAYFPKDSVSNEQQLTSAFTEYTARVPDILYRALVRVGLAK